TRTSGTRKNGESFSLNGKWRPVRILRGGFLRKARLVPASQNVSAQSCAFFRHRLADRPHALPFLVEHLVWPPASGQTNHRILARRKASAPHPACPRPTWRAHGPPRRRCGTLVPGAD